MIQYVHPGSGSWIWILIFYPSQIPDPDSQHWFFIYQLWFFWVSHLKTYLNPDQVFHFGSDSDQDATFYFDADPDPASKSNGDPCGSIPATLLDINCHYHSQKITQEHKGIKFKPVLRIRIQDSVLFLTPGARMNILDHIYLKDLGREAYASAKASVADSVAVDVGTVAGGGGR